MKKQVFSATWLNHKYGKRVAHLAEKDLAELQDKFDALKAEKRELLEELGLG